MKVFALAFCLFLAAQAAVLSESELPPTPEQQNEELDEFTAATLEAVDGYFEDDDDEDEEDVAKLEDPDFVQDEGLEPMNEVVHANVTEDGQIEVEDMVLSPEMFEVMFPHIQGHPGNSHEKTIHRRAALSSTSKFWPSGKVYYAYNTNLVGSKTAVRSAMNEWEKYTCVRFTYRPSGAKKYVQIRTKDTRCSATLGYTGRLQYLNLGKNCFHHKTILHELGHVLGLIHEHQHPTRDKYVTIVWDNINPVKKSNFQTKTGVSSWGYAYDPRSIMHYSSTAFKKTGCKSPCYTIKSKQSSSYTSVMGRSTHLSSRSDIPIVKKIYKCSSSGK